MDFFNGSSGLGAIRSTDITAPPITSSDFFEETPANLIKRTDLEMHSLRISDTNQGRLKKYLSIIEAHNTSTFLHSLRVGILSAEIWVATKKIFLEI